MKGKLLLIAAMLMAVASLSFAQPFQVATCASVDENFENPADLTTLCDGTDPLPDGTVGVWIDNSTGLPAAVPPYYTNVVTINGVVDMGMPGNFYSLEGFGNNNYAAGMSFHIEFCGPVVGGFQHCWVSANWGPTAAGPCDVFLPDGFWTCEVRTIGEPCVPTTEVNFAPEVAYGEQDMGACVTLCEGSTTVICVGPVPMLDRLPHVTVMPGCLYPPLGCDDDCTPANIWSLSPFAVSGVPGAYYFCANLAYSGEEGCVCVHLDFIEGVETVDLDVAFDGAVRLNWSASNSADLDKYIISRNGSEIASVASDVYSFVDESFEYGVNYTYELAALDLSGHRTVLATESVTPSEGAITVTEYALHQNFPNPFNPTTTIRFDLVKANHVSLKVFNATGQEVATMSGEFGAGVNFHNFDATNLTSGLYFYTVQIGDVYSATKKMLLVK